MDHWAFVHIMKTAGTSFRKMLEETPEISIYPTRDELAAHVRRRYLHVDDLLAKIESGGLDVSKRQFLCGHFPASFPERLPGTWRTVTFLRDPVRRTLSMIAHNHRQSGRLKRFFKPNVSKFLANEKYVESQIRDYQTKIFALPPTGNVNGPFAIDDAAFERAKTRLLETDFVGLTEQFAQSIALFQTLSGQRFSPPVYANKGRGYSATDADIAMIRKLVPRDIELYELAREKLQSSIAAAA